MLSDNFHYKKKKSEHLTYQNKILERSTLIIFQESNGFY